MHEEIHHRKWQEAIFAFPCCFLCTDKCFSNVSDLDLTQQLLAWTFWDFQITDSFSCDIITYTVLEMNAIRRCLLWRKWKQKYCRETSVCAGVTTIDLTTRSSLSPCLMFPLDNHRTASRWKARIWNMTLNGYSLLWRWLASYHPHANSKMSYKIGKLNPYSRLLKCQTSSLNLYQ